jgi:hypothetical protein
MPRLLRSVNNAFDFKTAEATELPGGFPAIRLQGTWKPDRLAHFVPDTGGSGAGESERMQRLPSHVPHYLVVFLGRDDLFPYRLEFRRKAPPPLPGQPPAEDSALVTLELYEVSLNGPIARERFFYDPGPLEYTEQTDRFLESLGVKKK